MSRSRNRLAIGVPRSRFGRWFDYALTISILGLLIVLAARIDQVAERSEAGVATVHDGDTLTVNRQRVRLRGLDAPEYAQTCVAEGKSYACGRSARSALADMTERKSVTCRGWERDRYDRLLAVCSAGNPPLDLNREMVRRGWAVAFGDYRSEEAAAHGAKRGLWRGDFQRPSDWRLEHHDDRRDESRHDALASLWNWLRQLLLP